MTRAVEIWCIDLGAAAPALARIEAATPRISADETARAGDLKDAAARGLWLASRTALRLLLERWTGADAARRTFERDGHGRPRLAGGGPGFSLSHTGTAMAVVIAEAERVGIDLERTRALHMSAARQAMILAAGAALLGGAGPAAAARGQEPAAADVIRGWTRIEAFAKARGPGAAAVLGALGIIGAPAGATTPETAAAAAANLREEAGLSVRDIDTGATGVPDLHGAVAVPAGTTTVAVHIAPTDVAGLAALASR